MAPLEAPRAYGRRAGPSPSGSGNPDNSAPGGFPGVPAPNLPPLGPRGVQGPSGPLKAFSPLKAKPMRARPSRSPEQPRLLPQLQIPGRGQGRRRRPQTPARPAGPKRGGAGGVPWGPGQWRGGRPRGGGTSLRGGRVAGRSPGRRLLPSQAHSPPLAIVSPRAPGKRPEGGRENSGRCSDARAREGNHHRLAAPERRALPLPPAPHPTLPALRDPPGTPTTFCELNDCVQW